MNSIFSITTNKQNNVFERLTYHFLLISCFKPESIYYNIKVEKYSIKLFVQFNQM